MATPVTPPPTTHLTLDEIPGPRALPVLGNVFDIDTADPLGGFVRMAEEYGPIFKIVTKGTALLLVAGPELNVLAFSLGIGVGGSGSGGVG